MYALFEQCSVAAQINMIVERDKQRVAQGTPSVFSEVLTGPKRRPTYCYRVLELTRWQQGVYTHSYYLSSEGILLGKTQYPEDGATLVCGRPNSKDWSKQILDLIRPRLDELELQLL